MANAYTMLVVDDEPPIRRFLRTSLSAAGYRVVDAEDAAGALAWSGRKARLVILDLGLPDRSGLRGDRRDTQALAGADHRVVGARRRTREGRGARSRRRRLCQQALRHGRIDRAAARGVAPCLSGAGRDPGIHLRRSVSRSGAPPRRRGGQEVKLSPKEFELLRHLVAHAGKVLTHRQLLREVWGPAQAEEVQYLRVFIRGLRQKLEPDPTRPNHILTELGVGYRLQLPPEQRAPER